MQFQPELIEKIKEEAATDLAWFGAGRIAVLRDDGVAYASAADAARDITQMRGGAPTRRMARSILDAAYGIQRTAYGHTWSLVDEGRRTPARVDLAPLPRLYRPQQPVYVMQRDPDAIVAVPGVVQDYDRDIVRVVSADGQLLAAPHADVRKMVCPLCGCVEVEVRGGEVVHVTRCLRCYTVINEVAPEVSPRQLRLFGAEEEARLTRDYLERKRYW
jgi:hypothetical protein